MSESVEFLRLFFSFDGRINRAAYWTAGVAATVYSVLIRSIAKVELVSMTSSHVASTDRGRLILTLLVTFLAILLVIWVDFAVGVKRWHDRGKSGWWVLLTLIPLVGQLWTLIECGFLPGTPGANRFGPSTRPQVDVAEAFT